MIGKILQQLRVERQMSRAAVANFIGVAQNSLLKWETGQKPVPRPRFLRFLDALGIRDDLRVSLVALRDDDAAARARNDGRRRRVRVPGAPSSACVEP
jgi:transcriptional regulator with XRE-family HTH domain